MIRSSLISRRHSADDRQSRVSALPTNIINDLCYVIEKHAMTLSPRVLVSLHRGFAVPCCLLNSCIYSISIAALRDEHAIIMRCTYSSTGAYARIDASFPCTEYDFYERFTLCFADITALALLTFRIRANVHCASRHTHAIASSHATLFKSARRAERVR